MVFTSLTFFYYFLPCMLALYFAVPKRFQNAALLSGSLLFYAWGEPKYIFLMGLQIVLGYVCGLLLEAYRHTGAGRFVCILSVGSSLSFLLYFKYAGFFLANIHALTGIATEPLDIALPAGISFYTFQIVSYLADVYRGAMAQRNIARLALYIAMFPQLIAGPIVRYCEIEDQLEHRQHSWESAAGGICRFITGMAKKILFANQLAELCTMFRETKERSVLFCWLYAIAFMLQIYYDFSGYSDMAIGLGRIFGFRFPENFRAPYASKSITEFWRRWHISLGMWFRDYVYIPMGGSRTGKRRQMLSILAVWILTGLWHGAAWNFVIWGLYFAVLLMLEKLWLLPVLKNSLAGSRIYTLFFVMAGFIIFDAPGLPWALHVIGGLFGAGSIPLVSSEALYCLRSFCVILLFAVFWMSPAARIFADAKLAGLAVLLFIMTAYLVDGSFQPFLYFRF